MRFGSFTKSAFANMGNNLRASQALASGKSYFRWAATGATIGAIKTAADNVLGIGAGEDRMPLMESIKRGAMFGAGTRMLKGIHTGSAARRRARGR